MSDPNEKDPRGDLAELRNQLDGNDPDLRKVAARRTVALMRSGENVQSLFSSMLRCVKSPDLEVKKLAYLYLVTYSTQEPEQAIMAVNTFIQDSQDPNPFVRALAVRTMCRIRLENVAENMIIPLKKCLSDPDPYVRKTASFGVSKLYDIIPDGVENARLFDELLSLLNDDNPMVVANTTAAILEINERRTTPVFAINVDTISPILNAINASSEWCQSILFDALSRYTPTSKDDATFLIDRLIPYLKHSNPAVVIGAFRCVFLFMDAEAAPQLFPQVIPPFITLVNSACPEEQYVALRTLSLFVQKYPKSLSKEIRSFFCKYNDPPYVKMEKLDIIVTISRRSNAQLVLNELAEYCNAVDVAFVRKSVRMIGQIALKMPEASRRCVDILVSLIQGKAAYAVEESVCVVCDLLRRYPGSFESILASICPNLESLKEPRAKAAGIWIIGEYCSLIEGVDHLLDPFLDTFHDEPPMVQLAILSAAVKAFCDKPDLVRDQLQFILEQATRTGTVPDVHNRALFYWRVLSADPNMARDLLAFSKSTVTHSGVAFDPAVLNELMRNMGSVAGVLHVVPGDFVRRVRFVPDNDDAPGDEAVYRSWHALALLDQSIVDLFADYDRHNMYLRIVNKSAQPLEGFAFALNKNPVGIAVAAGAQLPARVDPGDVGEAVIPLTINGAQVVNSDKNELQIALKMTEGVAYAIDRIPAQVATLPDGSIGEDRFMDYSRRFTATTAFTVKDATIADDAQLADTNVFVVKKGANKVYVSFGFTEQQYFIGELTQNGQTIGVAIKANSSALFSIVEASARALFAQK
jgi:vesicle coat complex subunit